MSSNHPTIPLRIPRQNSDYFVSSSRPRLATVQSPPESPSSPRTPGRPFLFSRQTGSNLNSPGVSFRVDDEVLVLEFSSTVVQVGLGGEEKPRSAQSFGPAQHTRSGDHSRWLPSASLPKRRKVDSVRDWGKDRELWQVDLRNTNFGLIEDKIERAVRSAIRDDLLVQDETKRRSFTIVVPPLLPQPLLSTILKTLFNQSPSPANITLISTPTICAVSAGTRSALVVDIGWQETMVTAIYEYREIQYRRTGRAMKLLSWETRNMLLSEQLHTQNMHGNADSEVSFDDVQEVLMRFVWAVRRETSFANRDRAKVIGESDQDVSLRLPSFNAGKTFKLPILRLSDPVETALLRSTEIDEVYDDDDLPLPLLIYQSLLSLAVDARGLCSQRILIVGPGSNIPGLKSRLLSDVSAMIQSRGWSPVHSYGSGLPTRPRVRPLHASLKAADDNFVPEEANKDLNPESSVPAHSQPQLPDIVLTKIQARTRSANARPDTGGDAETVAPAFAKGLECLGAWAGASIIAGLRIRGLVEIERERFLQHGLTGGQDRKRQSTYTQQHAALSIRPIIAIPGAGVNKAERSGWNLGVWA